MSSFPESGTQREKWPEGQRAIRPEGHWLPSEFLRPVPPCLHLNLSDLTKETQGPPHNPCPASKLPDRCFPSTSFQHAPAGVVVLGLKEIEEATNCAYPGK